MKVLLLIYIAKLLYGSLSANEIEQDVTGEVFAQRENDDEEVDHMDADSIKVTIQSKFDEVLNLYYLGESSSSFMGTIEPHGSLSLNSFPGHYFYATLGNEDLDPMASVEMAENVHYYTLVSTVLGKAIMNSTNIRNHQHPAVKFLDQGLSTAVAARFRSLSSRKIDLYEGPTHENGQVEATMSMGQDVTFNTYADYSYYYTPHNEPNKILGKFNVNADQVLYLMYDEEFPASEEVLNRAEKEVNYIYAHRNETGLLWRSYFGDEGPRGPPALYMWPANAIGEVHEVSSNHGQWKCNGIATNCQDSTPMKLELEVISLQPKAFIIHNFLSRYEADKIIELGRPNLKESLIGEEDTGGATVSDTRTSTNTWVNRRQSIETETITLRAADLLQIDQELLNSDVNAEDLQVVHYEVGQKYAPHHDWAVESGPETRYITLLFYLTDMASPDAGGETAFPKAAGGRGVKVHPGKGSAVLFYNLLEDGNSDDLSLHESIPVNEGEKWLANYWIWDPERK